MIEFLLGATAMASAIVGLMFLRFHRRTRDRFFLFFAGAFWLETLSRVWMWQRNPLDENETVVYVIRLIAYGLILAAILDKNLRRDGN
jgi:hypothetical protein